MHTTNTITVKVDDTEDSSPFCPVTDVEYDAGTIAAIAVCAILVGLVVIGTVVDIVLWASSSSSINAEKPTDSKESKKDSKSCLFYNYFILSIQQRNSNTYMCVLYYFPTPPPKHLRGCIYRITNA